MLGQTVKHFPQFIHLVLSIKGYIKPSLLTLYLMADFGQASPQAKHPVHLSTFLILFSIIFSALDFFYQIC